MRSRRRSTSSFPDSHVQSVSASQIPGWLEVVTENELVYSNTDASLLFVGRVIDAATKQDLTAKRLNAIRSIDFGSSAARSRDQDGARQGHAEK